MLQQQQQFISDRSDNLISRLQHFARSCSGSWTDALRSSFVYYRDIIMGTMVSQITSFTIIYPTLLFKRRSKKTSKLCVTGEFPSQRPVTRSFDVFCAWIKGWENNLEFGDLRHQSAHFDVTVMDTLSRLWQEQDIWHFLSLDHCKCMANV